METLLLVRVIFIKVTSTNGSQQRLNNILGCNCSTLQSQNPFHICPHAQILSEDLRESNGWTKLFDGPLCICVICASSRGNKHVHLAQAHFELWSSDLRSEIFQVWFFEESAVDWTFHYGTLSIIRKQDTSGSTCKTRRWNIRSWAAEVK